MKKQLKNDVNAPTRVIRFRIEVGLGVFWVSEALGLRVKLGVARIRFRIPRSFLGLGPEGDGIALGL